MSNNLRRLECKICGRSIYFLPAEAALQNGERLIELTCSSGHSDRYWDVEAEPLELIAPNTEMVHSAAVGF